MASCYQEKADGIVIDVRVQPRASAERVEGVVEGRLRLRLTAPPVDNAANAAAIALLARWLDVPRSRVSLVGGQTAREKRFHVAGDPSALAALVAARLA